jgi:hypothetical protein
MTDSGLWLLPLAVQQILLVLGEGLRVVSAVQGQVAVAVVVL